jgi:hypothetical protein
VSNALTLYRNRKTAGCSIEIYIGTKAVGNFIEVSAGEMCEQGLEIILKCLNGEILPHGETAELTTYSKEQERVFRRLHEAVSVHSPKKDEISIGKLRRQGSGYVVRKEDVVPLSIPCANEEFLTALNRAFTEF